MTKPESTSLPGGLSASAASRDRSVPRVRSLDVLNSTPDATVVLVSAPAGSGKSTLVRQWCASDARSSVEVTLAPHLDDPSSLARVLAEALERVGPDAPDTRASITGTEPTFSAVVLPALGRLAATRMCDFVLVIDDLHLVSNPSCHQVIAAVAEAVPPGSRIVLVSRSEAPPWLARSRVEGRLLELEPFDLSFDVGEAAALFEGLAVDVASDQLAAIVDSSEGWAVGLYLHALALKRHGTGGDLAGAPALRGPESFVSDYVRSQILDPLDADSRRFLTRTAVLDELRPDVCDALLDRTDSVAMLARLHGRIQLVIALDGVGQRYRYHHLFREALLTELTREAPEEFTALHRGASRWYGEHGDLDSAIRHAKAGHDRSLLGELVWSGVIGCITGRIDPLLAWLGDVPDVDIARDPWLTLAAAWLALQTGDSDGMDRWILHAEALAGRDWRSRAHTDEYAASLAFIVALVGRDGLDESTDLCQHAMEGLPTDSGFRSAATFIHGVCLTLQRDVDRGVHSLLEAERLARALELPLLVADALSWQGLLAMAAGDNTTGARLITAATDIIRRNQLDRLTTSAHCITAQALLLALRHDPTAATELGTARRLTSHSDSIAPWFAVCGRLIQARAATALGDGALARLLISEAKSHMTPDIAQSLANDLLDDAESSLKLLAVNGVSQAALTPAEIRVLQFLPSHLTIPQIGEHLFLSPNTVKTHTIAIYRKFGVSSRDDAVANAQRLGLVEAPPHD